MFFLAYVSSGKARKSSEYRRGKTRARAPDQEHHCSVDVSYIWVRKNSVVYKRFLFFATPITRRLVFRTPCNFCVYLSRSIVKGSSANAFAVIRIRSPLLLVLRITCGTVAVCVSSTPFFLVVVVVCVCQLLKFVCGFLVLTVGLVF